MFANGFPGEPDLSFTPPITATAVLPLPDGRVVAAGVRTFRLDGSTSGTEVVILRPDGSDSPLPWLLPSVFSTIYDIDQFDDGSFLVSGTWSPNGAPTTAQIAKLEPGGVVHPEFGANLGLRGEIRETVLLPGGGIVIAGTLTDPSDASISGIVRLNSNGNVDRTFTASGGARLSSSEGTVLTLKMLPNGKLLAGGEFVTFDGTPQAGLARLLPTGELDTTFRSPLRPGSMVLAMALQPDGRILVAGLVNLHGYARSTVVRLNTDGDLDPAFRPVSTDLAAIRSRMGLAVDDQSRVLLSGAFGFVNNVRYRGIVRLSPHGIPDPNFAPFSKFYPIPTVTSRNSRLALGFQGEVYNFHQAQGWEGFIPGILRLFGGDQDPSPPTILDHSRNYQNAEGERAEFTVQAIGFPSPSLQWFMNERAIPGATNVSLVINALRRSHIGILSVAASNSLGIVSQQIANILVLHRSRGPGEIDTSFRLEDPSLDIIHSVSQTSDGRLIVAALMQQGEANRILRYGVDGLRDQNFWVDLDLLPPFGSVSANLLPLENGKILVGGRFGGVGGTKRRNLARLLADGSLDSSFADLGGASGPITALLRLMDGRYCIAGSFTNIQGVDRFRLAILNPGGATDESFTPPCLQR